MRSPSPQNRHLADPSTLEQWLLARTEPSLRAVGWTPERDLHADYQRWAKAEGLPREVILCAELFEEVLSFHHVDCQRRLVNRKGQDDYEPCRALRLIPAIRAAA